MKRFLPILLLVALGRAAAWWPGVGEFDEILFSGAVLDYDLAQGAPQMPGFPLWIGLGKAVRSVSGCEPDVALRLVSALCSVALSWPLYRLARRLTEDEAAALLCVAFFQFQPAVWLHADRAFTTTPALCLLLFAYESATRARRPEPGSAEATRAQRPEPGSAEGVSPLPGAGGARLAGAVHGPAGRGSAPTPRKGLRPLTLGGIGASRGSFFLSLAVGIRPQILPLALPLAFLIRERPRFCVAFLFFCGLWAGPALLDTGWSPFLGLLRQRAELSLGYSHKFGSDLSASLLGPLWAGHPRFGLLSYGLALVGLGLLARRRPRAAGLVLGFTLVAAVWLLKFHGPIVRYKLPLLLPVALGSAVALRSLASLHPALWLAPLVLLLRMASHSLGALELLRSSTPPASALLDRLLTLDGAREFLVFPEPFWPLVRLARLTSPGFVDAREHSRVRQIPASKHVLILGDATGQPGPLPASAVWSADWHEPALDAMDQGRLARLFLASSTIVPGAGFWGLELSSSQSWRWSSGDSSLFLAPAPHGGRLRLGYDCAPELVAQAATLQLRLGSATANPDELPLLAREPVQLARTLEYRISAASLEKDSWTSLRLHLEGFDPEKLPWDGRSVKGVKFPLALRLYRLEWEPAAE